MKNYLGNSPAGLSALIRWNFIKTSFTHTRTIFISFIANENSQQKNTIKRRNVCFTSSFLTFRFERAIQRRFGQQTGTDRLHRTKMSKKRKCERLRRLNESRRHVRILLFANFAPFARKRPRRAARFDLPRFSERRL